MLKQKGGGQLSAASLNRNTLCIENFRYVGEIYFGNSIQVTDPCYSPDIWCGHTLNNVLPGKYLSIVRYDSEFGAVSSLIIINESMQKKHDVVMMNLVSDTIGVDSGQCGFFDFEKYVEIKSSGEKKRKFYQLCGEKTINNKCGIIPRVGIVSQSGFGDGRYCLYTQKDDKGNVFAAEIEFINPEED